MKINTRIISNGIFIALFTLLGVSINSILNTSKVYANNPAYPVHDVFGDGCTSVSNFNRWSTGDLANLVGMTDDPFRKGYMNARVYSPVLDWDDTFSSLYGVASPEKPIDYLNKFSFLTIPVPNNKWVENYLSRSYGDDNLTQPEYDIQALQNLVSGGGSPSQRTKFVANPFLYQQAAVVEPGGMPTFPAIRTLLGGNQYVNEGESIVTGGGFDSILGPERFPSVLEWGLLRIDLSLLSFADRLVHAPGGVDSAVDSIMTMAKQLIKITMNTDIPGGNIGGVATDWFDPSSGAGENELPLLAGFLDGVDLRFAGAVSTLDAPLSEKNTGPSRGDLGRHCNLGNGKQVPMYSFNNFGIVHATFVLPGTINSLFTRLMGRGMSNDGIHLTFGRTINGNKALDCYGKHITPTVNWITGETIESKAGLIGDLLNSHLGRAALDAVTYNVGGFVWEAAKRLPWPELGTMYYGLGMGFMFAMKPSDAQLPASLETRSIDWVASGSELVDSVMPNTSGSDMHHGNSVNGLGHDVTFKLKLKEPYILKPRITSEIKVQDGSQVNVDISLRKNGYSKKTHTASYNESSFTNGGPTNDPGQVKPRVKVVRMIAEPGSDVNDLTGYQYGGSLKETARRDLPNGVDYIQGDSLCDFMKNKVKSGGIVQPGAVRECDYIEPDTGDDVSMDASTSRVDLKNITFEIPAETEPGTKYCYAVYTDMFSNDMKYSGVDYWDISTGGYETSRDKRMLTRTHCIVSGYKPSFQVRGGDLIAGGVVDTEVNAKEYLADPSKLRTYGSWVEYGTIAGGAIHNLSSGAGYRVGMASGLNPLFSANIEDVAPEDTLVDPNAPCYFDLVFFVPIEVSCHIYNLLMGTFPSLPATPPVAQPANPGESPSKSNLGSLSFSNSVSASGAPRHGNFGDVSDGFGKIATQFSESAGSATTLIANEVDVAELEGGVYILNANTKLTSSRQIDDRRSVVLLVPGSGKVVISSNIELKDSYPSEAELSQVVIAPLESSSSYDLNIEPHVTRVDSWLINPNGKTNTCFIDGAPLTEQVPRGFDWPCYNTLTVNGPVSADTLLLRRSGSRDQNDVPPYDLKQSVAGENFNLRPDAYIWAINYVSDFGRKLITTNLLDLPPRF